MVCLFYVFLVVVVAVFVPMCSCMSPQVPFQVSESQ